jgi:hypothetical protein
MPQNLGYPLSPHNLRNFVSRRRIARPPHWVHGTGFNCEAPAPKGHQASFGHPRWGIRPYFGNEALREFEPGRRPG